MPHIGMGVRVDESRGNGQPHGINHVPGACSLERTYCGYAVAHNAQVGTDRYAPRAVEDHASANHDVELQTQLLRPCNPSGESPPTILNGRGGGVRIL